MDGIEEVVKSFEGLEGVFYILEGLEEIGKELEGALDGLEEVRKQLEVLYLVHVPIFFPLCLFMSSIFDGILCLCCLVYLMVSYIFDSGTFASIWF